MATLTSVITGSPKAQGLRAGCPPFSFNLRQEDHSVSFISHPFNASVRGRRALERATGPSVTTSGRRSLIVCRVVGAPLRSSSPSPVGLWYGKKSSSSFLPTTNQLIHLYKANKIQKMWLCCDTPQDGQDILQHILSDGEANIKVVLYIPTSEVRKIPDGAIDWIGLITKYQRLISYVCLGKLGEMNNTNDITMIEAAMDIILSINSTRPIKASTLVDVNTIFGSYDPTLSPSSYTFLEWFRNLLSPVFERLRGNSTPLFVKTFPNFAIHPRIGLDNYLLKECALPYLNDNQTNLGYKYVFDAMVDSISFAKAAMGFGNVDISVVSGWPTTACEEANINNAQTYNKNLLRHVNEDTPRETKRIDHFIFSVLDEDLLPANDVFDWKHFGTFTPWKNETFPTTETDGSAEAT